MFIGAATILIFQVRCMLAPVSTHISLYYSLHWYTQWMIIYLHLEVFKYIGRGHVTMLETEQIILAWHKLIIIKANNVHMLKMTTTCRSTNVLGSSQPAKRALARPMTISPASLSLTSLFVQHFLTKDWELFPFKLDQCKDQFCIHAQLVASLPGVFFGKFIQIFILQRKSRESGTIVGLQRIAWSTMAYSLSRSCR